MQSCNFSIYNLTPTDRGPRVINYPSLAVMYIFRNTPPPINLIHWQRLAIDFTSCTHIRQYDNTLIIRTENERNSLGSIQGLPTNKLPINGYTYTSIIYVSMIWVRVWIIFQFLFPTMSTFNDIGYYDHDEVRVHSGCVRQVILCDF